MPRCGFDNGFSRSLATDGLGAGFGKSRFTPYKLDTDLWLWLDGQDTSTMYTDNTETIPSSNGSPVGRWRDKSKYSRHAEQSTASAKPTLSSSAIKGCYGVTFDGGDILSTITPHIPTNTIGELWTVSLLTGAGSQFIVETLDASGGNFIQQSWTSASASYRTVLCFPSIFIAKPVGLTLLRSTWSASASVDRGTFESDDARATTGTSGMLDSGPPRPVNIGSRYNGFGAIGAIGEVIWIGRLLTSVEAADLKGYLKLKWGTP